VNSTLSHLLFNVRSENMPFYADLMSFLGWSTLHQEDGILGVGGPGDVSIWFSSDQVNDIRNDYDGAGLNHLGIGAPSIADVDATVTYLAGRNVPALFDTPRHRPEFAADEASTYYQVMFETPDRILVEVVYTGAL
jgi:catechol 2,3-dioxygenase-like lactoylglutathione lyase family enzyme